MVWVLVGWDGVGLHLMVSYCARLCKTSTLVVHCLLFSPPLLLIYWYYIDIVESLAQLSVGGGYSIRQMLKTKARFCLLLCFS